MEDVLIESSSDLSKPDLYQSFMSYMAAAGSQAPV